MRVVTDLTAVRLDARPRPPTAPPARRPPGPRRPGRPRPAARARRRRRADGGARRAGLYDDAGPAGPAVGDWVALRGELAVAVLPRRSAFTRTVAGRSSAAQVVAANLDAVLVVDALVGATRLRRVERYLAVAWSSGATPVVVLTKADLCDDVAAAVAEVAEDAARRRRAAGQLGHRGGAGRGRARCSARAAPARWWARRASGKSSLANALAGASWSPARGRSAATAAAGTPPPPASCTCCPAAGCSSTPPACASWPCTTTTRASTPPTPTSPGWRAECRFRDCAHRTEPGCAVAAAIDDGALDPARLLGLAQAAGRGAPAAAARRRPRPGRREGPAARLPPGACADQPQPAALTGPVGSVAPCACW